jgi:glycosyltransferase involved in cell wall biosynthesis
MKLAILYHIPFWRTADGGLAEAEGSFARYVDSLAPYFDEILICAPEQPAAGDRGTRVRAQNVRLAGLPFFEGPRQFYPQLPAVLSRLRYWLRQVDVLHCRVPTPAAFPAFLLARWRGMPVFLLVVGDLRGLLPTLPYRGIKRRLFAAYTAWEEFGLAVMTRRALTFANGRALTDKHARAGVEVIETTTTTISQSDIIERADTCGGGRVRLLCVSRIDPRKGLQVLPAVLARLGADGHDVSIDIVGPAVGRTGERERTAIERAAVEAGVADRLQFTGSLPLDELLPRYRSYDLFVLPTLPGEGIPRVLLESMAAGVPIVTSRVAGIPSLIRHEENGLLVDEASVDAVTSALRRLIGDPGLRQRLIRGGRETAKQYTLDRQAARMMAQLDAKLPVTLREVAPLA